MDLSTLLTSEPDSLARYLRQNASQLGSEAVTKNLLAGIENESLPPRIYSVWLTASGDCQAVNAGLRQQFSKSIRHSAIARFGKLFRSRRVKEVWNALGDTAGIVELLDQASVADVKHFCREIGRTATSKVERETRQRLTRELYKALQCQRFPSAVLRTLDKRPLASQHHKLLPACSEDMVLPTFDGLSKADKRQAGAVFEVHVTSFRRRCLSVLKDENTKVDVDSLKALLDVQSNETTTYHGSQLSENVAFALETLRLLAGTRSTKDIDSPTLLAALAIPLFRRLCRHKCKPDVVGPAIDSYVQYSRAHIGLGVRSLDVSPTSVIASVVRLWSRHPDHLGNRLSSLLSLAPSTQTITASQIQSLIELIPWSLRYGFLRLAARSLPYFRIDIDSDDELKNLEFTWTPELVLALPNVESRSLLQRLIKVKTGDFFNAGWGSYDERFKHEPNMVLLWVSQDEPDLLQFATESVEESKKEATKARQQADRARWLCYALHCATAPASLDLYGETLRWARRYTRDPLTATEVYSQNSLHREKSLSLLCGFSEKTKSATATPDEVYESVRKGNLICEELLQTACDSLTEPSFQSHNWNGFTQLFDLVVQKRLERVHSLQDEMHLSDAQAYDIVWKGTIETCLKLERIGLEDKNASLGFNSVGGPLLSVPSWGPSSRYVLKEPRPATLRFLDTLAQRRNELWTQYRPTRYPATSTLPDLYPKGLSVDYLLPVEIGKDGLSTSPDVVPYLRGRGERAVFVVAEAAFYAQPEDDETNHAIGPFEEDWKVALKLYVASSPDRLAAAMTAWKYAVGSLSAPRLDPVEAFLYWSPIFQSALSVLDLYGPWKEELSDPPVSALFRIDDCDLSTEWHPDPRCKADEVKARRLDRTRLDDMVHKVSHYTNDVTCVSYRSDVHLPHHKPTLIWSRYDNKRMPATMRETLIVAVMLYIGGQHNISPGLLSEPFPSTQSPRFPPVYLDGEFLDLEDLGQGSMWLILERLSKDIPPSLLLHLIKGVIAVADHEKERTPVDAFKLLMILVKSDRPQVGLDMIQEIILERPMDSSWQRALLTNGLFNALPKHVAEEFLQRLSQAMQQKLAQQATRKPDASTSQAPLIKVTTVKMLSKLLSGAQFIDARSASNILTALLAQARHLDIRVSVVETLIEILATMQDSQIKDDILVAFEQHAVPAMSSIDERKPPSEQGWQRYEQDATELPEIYMEANASGLPPVLESVLLGLQKVDAGTKDQLFTRVLLPTLTGSIESNKRWMTLFFRHMGVGVHELPSLPLKSRFLTMLLNYPEHLPAPTLELWLRAFTTRYDPSPTMLEITQRVQENPKLRESNAGKHWLEMFNPNTSQLLNGKRPAALLRYEWKARIDGPSIEQLQKLALRHADVILRKADANFNDWNAYCADLRPPAWQSEAFSTWNSNVKPVIEQLCIHTGTLRCDQTWQKDPNRVPRVLPDPLRMNLRCLLPADTGNHDADIETLCNSITDTLSNLCGSGRAFGARYDQIVTFIRGLGLSVDDLMKVALRFGSHDVQILDAQGRWSTFYDLSIDLAKQLVQASNAPLSSELCQKVVNMIHSWTKSVDEDVRMVGYRLLDAKADRTGKKPWYTGV